MKKIFSYCFLLILVFSCQEDDKTTPTETEPNLTTGFITGKVYANNTSKTIGSALVFSQDELGNFSHTYSDAQGDFVLELPTGTQKVYIQTGDGEIFRTLFTVNVIENQSTAIAQNQTVLTQNAPLAYLPGNFDAIEIIIANLGYTATELQHSDLTYDNYAAISQYKAIFLNCGSDGPNPSTDMLFSSYVTNGGSIYASDWSLTYLVGGNNNVTFCGPDNGFIPDYTLCANTGGNDNTEIPGNIVFPLLSNAIGLPTIPIFYNLGQFQIITAIDTTYWTVLIDTANDGPAMIATNQFFDATYEDDADVGGNQEGWITICHYPPGNSDNPITITVNDDALQAHLNHGDTIGPCSSDGNSGNGNVYYTNFHHHYGESDENIETILEYIILNL